MTLKIANFSPLDPSYHRNCRSYHQEIWCTSKTIISGHFSIFSQNFDFAGLWENDKNFCVSPSVSQEPYINDMIFVMQE